MPLIQAFPTPIAVSQHLFGVESFQFDGIQAYEHTSHLVYAHHSQLQLREHHLVQLPVGPSMLSEKIRCPMLANAHERQFVTTQTGGHNDHFEAQHTNLLGRFIDAQMDIISKRPSLAEIGLDLDTLLSFARPIPSEVLVATETDILHFCRATPSHPSSSFPLPSPSPTMSPLPSRACSSPPRSPARAPTRLPCPPPPRPPITNNSAMKTNHPALSTSDRENDVISIDSNHSLEDSVHKFETFDRIFVRANSKLPPTADRMRVCQPVRQKMKPHKPGTLASPSHGSTRINKVVSMRSRVKDDKPAKLDGHDESGSHDTDLDVERFHKRARIQLAEDHDPAVVLDEDKEEEETSKTQQAAAIVSSPTTISSGARSLRVESPSHNWNLKPPDYHPNSQTQLRRS